MMKPLQALLFCTATFGLLACNPSDDTAATSGAGLSSGQSVCDDIDYDDMVAGLVKTGDNSIAQVRYVGSSPAPPAEDDNQWTVQLLDMTGAPLSDGVVSAVRLWMPLHGHGTTVEPVIGAADGDGMVDVTDIDFRMPGVWTVTFTVATNQSVDTATFGVCIE